MNRIVLAFLALLACAALSAQSTCEIPSLYCEGVDADGDGDGICDDQDNCLDATAANYQDPENGYCSWPELNCSPVEYDGWTYSVVPIGDQCWFTENLRTTILSNGDFIEGHWHDGFSHTENDTWKNSDTPLRATSFDALPSPENNCVHLPETVCIPFLCDSATLFDELGYLYNGFSVIDDGGLCPNGWRVPSDLDWMTLETHIGMPAEELELEVASRGIEEEVNLDLYSSNPPDWMDACGSWEGNGATGFNAIRGGYIQDSGRSSNWPSSAFWTSTTKDVDIEDIHPAQIELDDEDIQRLYYRSFSNPGMGIFRSAVPMSCGASVRCIKDQ